MLDDMLNEEFLVRFEDVTEEAKKNDALPGGVLMRVRARAHRAGRVTANGNLYAPERFHKEAERLKPLLDEGEVLMFPRHPRITRNAKGEVVAVEAMSPAMATGTLRALEVLPDDEGDGTADVYIEADLGHTDAGRNISALVKMGAKVPISSRAHGSHTKMLLTDKHPLAAANQSWVGKEIRVINEDFSLRTFDFVEKEASGGSRTTGFREEETEEENMSFDVKKLTDDEWKQVEESERVKKLVEDAVKAKGEELEKDFAERIQKQVDEKVAERVNSEEFANDIADILKGESGDEEQEAGVVCADCGAAVPKGGKFCAACGTKAVLAKKESTPDEKDKVIEALNKKLDDMAKDFEGLKKTNDELVGERDQAKQKAAVAESMDELLKDEAASVATKVREEMAKHELTEDNVEELVKDSMKRVRGIYEALGVDPKAEPKGEGQVLNEDEDKGEDKKGLTDDQKKHQSNLKNML
jgi:hypothetical protein